MIQETENGWEKIKKAKPGGGEKSSTALGQVQDKLEKLDNTTRVQMNGLPSGVPENGGNSGQVDAFKACDEGMVTAYREMKSSRDQNRPDYNNVGKCLRRLENLVLRR